MIAFRAGAPDAVKESLLEAWPEVASADGVLAAALKEKWDDAYVARMVASAPEVTHVNLPEGQGEDHESRHGGWSMQPRRQWPSPSFPYVRE